ncbi:MAG: hypothetical protein KDE21_05655 [Novosphingobium sp.]|nr:hypothetical protein [Novosphingobium sp.]
MGFRIAGTRPSGERGIFASTATLAILFTLIAVALKFTTFGDTNRSADDLFYFLVGQRMHEGLLPYVDVWDRKPLGLFLIYYLIAGVSTSVLAYQIVACIFVAATAVVIARIVCEWTGWQGGLFAGLAYLVIAVIFEGAGGNAPDFYNLLIACAAFLIVREMDALAQGTVRWPIWTAMALCGLAITIKQTTLFESIFFGLYVLVTLHRAGRPLIAIARVAATCAAIGALPTLAIAACYWQLGHWREFWHAMVISNLAKAAIGGGGFRLTGILLRLAVLLPLALWGLFGAGADRRTRRFLAGWLIAALVGFLAVPNFFVHYTLPLLVPLCVAAGLVLGRHMLRLAMIVALVLYASLWYHPPSRSWSRASAEAMDKTARLIRQHDPGGGLLAFDAPSYLYALSGKRFLSPLVFPHHLSSAIENDVSHLPTHAAIDAILTQGPGVVVMARDPLIQPVNVYSRERVSAYARANCRLVEVVTLRDAGARVPFEIWGDCLQNLPSTDKGTNGGRG